MSAFRSWLSASRSPGNSQSSALRASSATGRNWIRRSSVRSGCRSSRAEAELHLACVWSNFRSAGAERLIFCRVLEARSLLRYVTGAIPGAAATVVQLRVPLGPLRQRLSGREPQPDWYLDAASALTSRLDASEVADFVVDNDERAPDEVAAKILGLVGWLG